MSPVVKSILTKAANVFPADSDNSSRYDYHPTALSFPDKLRLRGPCALSLFSIASISSYGPAVEPVTQDSLEYAREISHLFDGGHVALHADVNCYVPESTYSDPEVNRMLWDSIMVSDQYTSVMESPLFDNLARVQNSIPSESMVVFDPPTSVHNSLKEDDTMITMFDGGHVRRRPVSSFAEVAFCVQVEGNNCTTLSGRVPPLASAKKPPPTSLARLLPLQGRVQVNAPPVLLVHRLRHSLHPMSNQRCRKARAHGLVPMRGIEQSHISRSSMHKTIEEDTSSSPLLKHPTPLSAVNQVASPLVGKSVYVKSQSMYSEWDEERGVVTLRPYYALRDDVHKTTALQD
ncbi:hypothetical protein ONZ51_g7778 [Trametes cubensis]|uniref:Uncharacterized protein n=1 Tax=Trametes cubensis TaxID=1111947 RepID=A0AAD7X743_9APHY|nr:hypothetical protein ONZ51_g7778 [Trametes cubensis]